MVDRDTIHHHADGLVRSHEQFAARADRGEVSPERLTQSRERILRYIVSAVEVGEHKHEMVELLRAAFDWKRSREAGATQAKVEAEERMDWAVSALREDETT